MTTAASSGGDVTGYAIPIAKVLRIADDLRSGVTSSRYAYGRPAFLGVALGDASSTVAGAYPGTPAAGVGLTEGDTITAVDGTTVSTSSAAPRGHRRAPARRHGAAPAGRTRPGRRTPRR